MPPRYEDLHESSPGYRLSIAVRYHEPGKTAEKVAPLSTLAVTARVTVKRVSDGVVVIAERTASVSADYAHHFECALTSDDIAALTPGAYQVTWRFIYRERVVKRGPIELLVVPSDSTSLDLSGGGPLFDDEDNSIWLALI